MATGTFDYELLTGNFDYQIQGEFPDFETSIIVLATVYPDVTVNLNNIYGVENLALDPVGLELIS
jgi:hypothetical protein